MVAEEDGRAANVETDVVLLVNGGVHGVVDDGPESRGQHEGRDGIVLQRINAHGGNTNGNTIGEAVAQDGLRSVDVTLRIGVVGGGDGCPQGVECGQGWQREEEESGRDGLGDGKDESSTRADHTANDGPLLGTDDEPVDGLVDVVVPSVGGIGEEEAATEEPGGHAEGVGGGARGDDGAVDDAEDVGEVDEQQGRRRAQPG